VENGLPLPLVGVVPRSGELHYLMGRPLRDTPERCRRDAVQKEGDERRSDQGLMTEKQRRGGWG